MNKRSAFLGAAFLMATSAIGPGFLTQTSLFTQELLSAFGFVILISIILDIGVQVNVWSIITMAGKPAQDIANGILPGMGYLLASIIAFGGLAFNIGNVAGTGLAIETLTGLSPVTGAIISSVIVLFIFWHKQALLVIDNFVKLLGIVMVVLTIYVAIVSKPPLGEALHQTFWPEKINWLTIITIVGGTVGGYICFSGAHRLLDAGITGKQHLKTVKVSAGRGILITSIMRYVLFLAALGVVSGGAVLTPKNPAASVFEVAAGNPGRIFFGIVLWIAAITSVIGASYTTITFWKSLVPFIRKYDKMAVSIFIIVSLLLFCLNPQPVKLLLLAGAVNGLLLPLALAILLIAARKQNIVSEYKHPVLWQVFGWAVVAIMGWMAYKVLAENGMKLLG